MALSFGVYGEREGRRERNKGRRIQRAGKEEEKEYKPPSRFLPLSRDLILQLLLLSFET